ncbi:MAG: TIGR02301 family protein [Xanthobacteraceae bacterium]
MILRRFALAWLTLCLGIGPAPAQFFQSPFGSPPQPRYPSRPPQAAHKTPKTEPQSEAPPAADVTIPYDTDLERLAMILGALHFLRGICGYNEGQKWRLEAQTLIEAEAPAGKRHNDMVQSFNRGFTDFQQSYRTCTPAAQVVIRRYLEEGAQIARDITARYAD